MKIKICDPRIWETTTGKKKVLFRDENGNQFDSWDLSLVEKKNQLVEGVIKSRTFKGRIFNTFVPLEEKKEEKKVELTPQQVSSDVWERRDRWQAKMSAWKSACTLYEGTGKEAEARKLAQEIFEDIISAKTESEEIEEYLNKEAQDLNEPPTEEDYINLLE